MRFQKPTITLAVVLVFCAVNIYSYFTMHSPFYDGVAYFGWPLNMYVEGGLAGIREIIWTGLIGNAVIALYVASVADIAFIAIKIFGSPQLK